METSYTNLSSYSDVWRTSPSRHSVSSESPRSFTELSMNTLPMPSLEFDQFPNVFSFSPCPPGYKDLTVFKEKAPHDIADALLSLKHAVVHPQFSGQLSPLSPAPPPPPMSHFGHNQVMNAGPFSSQNHQGLAYPVSHQGPMFHNPYPTPAPSQYASPYPEPGPNPSNQAPPQANVHFPSMSVNVSMSMNVGMPPGLGNTQYNPVPPQQWPPQPQSPTLGQYHPGYTHTPSIQSQYGGYNSQPYPPSYSFSSDFRSDGRGGIYYKHSDGFKDTKFCTVGHLKRSKFLSEKTPPPPPGVDPNALKTNMCRICGKTYARPSTLKTHLRTHSGEKPYKCTTCNKSFSQAANLTAHIRTHSGEKPFRCPICDRRFSQSSSVTTHMRTHSGERPYRCRLCKKAFSDSSTLTKHLRIHSGEKPYQCKLCLLRFSQSGNLNRHMRVHANTG